MTVATSTELWRLGATELANAIKTRQVSSREAVEAHLRRIEAVNPRVNAVPLVLGDRALADAEQADRSVARGDDLGPLHGVPFTVKANIDLAGTATSHGLKALANAVPDLDAPGVARIRAAGGIPLGRTNLPDFAIGWHADSELWGATVNPWDASRTPGGSSGGDAAAVATGMSPLGIGNDGGGSLRWPAQCCGISTLKPTLGRIPRASVIEPVDMPIGQQLMGVDGPLARRVADLRTALAVMAGATWRDPWSVPVALRGSRPRDPIRVALVVDPAGMGVAKQVQEGVRRAGETLEDAGYAVDEVEPPSIDRAAAIWLDMSVLPNRLGWEVWAPAVREFTKAYVVALFETAGEQDAGRHIQSFVTRQQLLRAWGEFQEEHPLIVAPICTDIPFRVGADRTTTEVSAITRAMRMAVAINALGLPAVALPVGVQDGLPQSVQVIGGRYREDLCLDAAEAIEDRLGVITPIEPR
jgi:amidase